MASGSSGNAIYLESRGDALLIDAGISRLQIEQRISAVGGSMENIRALLVSHEHSDHVKGMPVLMKRYPFPAYMTAGTLRALHRQPEWTTDSRVETFHALRPFQVGAWTVRAFPTPHDAEESVGFILEAGGVRVGIATDMGEVWQEVVTELSGVHGLVLEFNHDPDMLTSGPYPAFLKKRIAGPGGHLSNEEAGGLLQSVAHRGLGGVILAHLSETNNHPDKVRRVATQHLKGYATKLEVASRDQPRVLRIEKEKSSRRTPKSSSTTVPTPESPGASRKPLESPPPVRVAHLDPNYELNISTGWGRERFAPDCPTNRGCLLMIGVPWFLILLLIYLFD